MLEDPAIDDSAYDHPSFVSKELIGAVSFEAVRRALSGFHQMATDRGGKPAGSDHCIKETIFARNFVG